MRIPTDWNTPVCSFDGRCGNIEETKFRANLVSCPANERCLKPDTLSYMLAREGKCYGAVAAEEMLAQKGKRQYKELTQFSNNGAGGCGRCSSSGACKVSEGGRWCKPANQG